MDITSMNPMAAGKTAYDANTANSRVSDLTRQVNSAESDELRAACNEFEGIFVKMMLDAMRKTLSEDTLIPKNAGEKLFEDKLYDEYAQSMSQTANLGIADMMYRQLENSAPGARVNLGS